jgi:hypothetical protein
MTPEEDKKKENLKNGCIGCLGIIVILFLGMVSCSVLFPSKEKTAEEKLDEWYNDISKITCQRVLKEKLRDPDSYKRSGDFSTSNDTGTNKVISWKFRAKNGLGGYNIGYARCNVNRKNNGTVSVTFTNQ